MHNKENMREKNITTKKKINEEDYGEIGEFYSANLRINPGDSLLRNSEDCSTVRSQRYVYRSLDIKDVHYYFKKKSH